VNLKELVIPKLTFAASSGFATAVDYGVFFLLNALGIPPVFAQLSAAFCGMLVNFFLQKRFVFDLKGRTTDAFVLSLIRSLGGMLLSTLCIALLVQVPLFAKQLLLAKLLTTGCIFFYNFYLKRYIFSNNQAIVASLKRLNLRLEQNKRPLIRGFAFLAFLAGLWLVPDFGVGWDEHVQREHGLVSARVY
jgi:putative flippase GtrA